MLAANEAVARYFSSRGLPTLNRYHGEPDEERLGIFMRLLGAYGVEVPRGPLTSKQLNQVLKKLDGHPEQRALHQLALRSMMQAVYSSEQAGHYGLGASDYLHFTSPIRRYPDLMVHRLLKSLWSRSGRGSKKQSRGEEALEETAQQSSERERAAMQVEREVNALYSCLLMKDRVGEQFPATVTGLSENGFYVELNDIFVEGLVRGETIFPNFELDQETYRMVFGDGRVVKVGQSLEVALTSVNIKRRQLDFAAVAFDGEALESPSRGPRKPKQRAGRDAAPAPQRRRGGDVETKPARRTREREEEGPRVGTRGAQRGGWTVEPVAPREALAARGVKRGRVAQAEGPSEKRQGRTWDSASRGDKRQRETRPPQEGKIGRDWTTNARDERASARASTEAPRTEGGFSARAVLDRLWKERGGRKSEAAPRGKPSHGGGGGKGGQRGPRGKGGRR